MRTTTLLAAAATALLAGPAAADATLDFALSKGKGAPETVKILVHAGKALLRIEPPQSNKELLFDSTQESFVLLDHRHHKTMRVDEPSVIQFADQAQQMLAMARGFSQQLALLPPDQRNKLKNLIGGDSLDKLAAASKPPAPGGKPSLTAAGTRQVANIACKQLELTNQKGKIGEVCLADPGALPLAQPDYDTLDAMRHLSQRLAQKAGPIAQQLGIPLPPVDDKALSGLPVAMRNLADKQQTTLTLTRIANDAVPPESLLIPGDYKPKSLTAWKF